MGLAQFANSIRSIAANRHVDPKRAMARHCLWQVRKALDLFPFEQGISRSRIIAAHRRCGVSALIHSQGLYDYDNMKLIQFLLREGGVFFDVGANIGSYTLIASEQERAQVFAFEPHPGTFRLLKGNVELNGRKNVTLLNVALGDRTGRMFLIDDGGSATSHLRPDGSPGTIPVPCMRAEDVCRAQRVMPTCVKVDVEGFEHEVLTGFGSCLSSVEALFLEINGLSDERSTGAAEIHSLVTSQGFAGPFACDFGARRFSSRQVRTAQDAVYVSEPMQRGLRQRGFEVETVS